MHFFSSTSLTILTPLLLLLASAPILAETPAPFRHDFPRVGQFEVVTGDFHMHTILSDATLTPRERVDEAYRLGYDVIAITDHHITGTYSSVRQAAKRLGIVALKGYEGDIRRDDHYGEHYNVVGVTGGFNAPKPGYWSDLPGENVTYYRDEMRRAVEYSGIVIYNHPHMGFRDMTTWGVEQGYIVGIEVRNDHVYNGYGAQMFNGVPCYPNAFDYALEHNLAVFANTDAHKAKYEQPARTLVLVEERTPEGVMDAIRARRTAAWFEGLLWGRKELLSDLLKATVNARAADGKTVLENRGPITLQGSIGDVSFDVPAYGSTAIDVNPKSRLQVKWTNVWTSSKTQLTTKL